MKCVPVRLDERYVEMLKVLAEGRGSSVSHEVREIVQKHLDAEVTVILDRYYQTVPTERAGGKEPYRRSLAKFGRR